MPDFAELGFKIDKTPVDQAATSLDKLTASATKTGTAAAGAQAGINRAVQAIRDLQAAYRSGVIGGNELVMGVATLQRQADQLRGALAKVPPVIESVGNSGVTNFGRLRGSLTTLLAQLTSINPALASTFSIISQLGLGAGVTVGLLVGAGGLAYALAKVTEQTRKAQAAYDAYMASLTKATPLALVGAQMDALQEKVGLLGALLAAFPALSGAFTTALLDKWIPALKAVTAQYDELLKTMDRLRNQQIADRGKAEALALFKALTERTVQQAGEFSKDPAKGWERLPGIMRDLNAEIGTLNTIITNTKAPLDRLELEDRLRQLVRLKWELAHTARSDNNGLTSFRGNMLPEWQGTGGTGQPGDVPAFLRGQRPEGLPAFRADSKEIATNWQSVASSVANTVTLLANADDATSRWLGNMVNLVGLIADANQELKEIGKLSTGSIVGLIGGGLGLLAGLFGEDAGSRRSREIAEENVRALERNSRALDNVTAGITGNAFTTARGGVAALLGAGPSGLGMGPRGTTTILNTAAVSAILAGQGTSLSELREFAKSLGITLDTTSTRTFIESLEKLNEQMQQMALVTLKSFGSQLDLINRQWALGNVTDPLAKIADLLKLITGEQGSPGLATLGNFDLSSGGGRNAALTFLQNQLLKAQNGGLTTAELGGLTVQQYLDFLSQFGALLNEANQALQATVDNLQSFADSLKLDQSLTTLSPGQQLAEARRQYEDVLRAAQAGDLNAANRLPDVARQFLSASRAYNASSPAYAADFARVLADTEAVQKLLQGQEGWIVLEKPLVNVVDNTQSTVDRLETLIEVQRVGLQETVDKLDAIRSELVAQVLATKIGFEGGKV